MPIADTDKALSKKTKNKKLLLNKYKKGLSSTMEGDIEQNKFFD